MPDGADVRALVIESITKRFVIPHERLNSLKGYATRLFRPVPKDILDVLLDVSFEIRRGEFFGIAGRNGSGKSTLLKILAGVYRPTAGAVEVNGSLATLIELGVGFNGDLSARDNIFLNGAILGMRRKEIASAVDAIFDFSELERFADQKLKNFSSGMQVRLAFAIAIQADADILLVDEVLAVGDANFQAKCFEVFRRLKSAGRTVVFVSHDMSTMKEFCDRGLLLHDGRIVSQGGIDEVIRGYEEVNRER